MSSTRSTTTTSSLSNITDECLYSNHSNHTVTNINGLPAKYVLAKDPNDPTRLSYVVAKVLDIPQISGVSETTHVSESTHTSPNPVRIPSSYISYDFSDTPLHLCDPKNLITQHRRSDYNLPHRTIDISKQKYTHEEMEWYADPESRIPQPKRLVMISKLRCYLCGDFQKSDDDIHYESGGDHTYGYRYCSECRPYFLDSLYKAIKPIIQFRRKYEEWLSLKDHATPHPFIWVARTRRDKYGKRIVGGNMPYKYTKWHIINWVACKHSFPRISQEDGISIVYVEESGLSCEQIEDKDVVEFNLESITKLVSLMDIYITNLGLLSDPEYDPNNDDPLNKYSYKEQCEMFKAAFNM
jgi:hypothetical protein